MASAAVARAPDQNASNLSRLDRLLVLVTEHESQNRKQEMKVSDLNRRLTTLEDRLTSELLHIAPLQERDVVRELDMARLAMEGLVKQLLAITHTMQELQKQQHQAKESISQWQATASSLEARQAAFEQQVAAMQEAARGARLELVEVDALRQELVSTNRQIAQLAEMRREVDEVKQQHTSTASLLASAQAATTELRRHLSAVERQQAAAAQLLESRLDEQAEQLQTALLAAVEQRAQVLSSEVRHEVAEARKDVLVSASAARSSVERWVQGQAAVLSDTAGALSEQAAGLGAHIRGCEQRVHEVQAAAAHETTECRRTAHAAGQAAEAAGQAAASAGQAAASAGQAAAAAGQAAEASGQEVRRLKKHVVKWQHKFVELEAQAAGSSGQVESLVAPLKAQLAEMQAAFVHFSAHIQQLAGEASSSRQVAASVRLQLAALAGAVCSCLQRCTAAAQSPALPQDSALSLLPPSMRPQPFSFHPMGNPAMESAVADLASFVTRLQSQVKHASMPPSKPAPQGANGPADDLQHERWADQQQLVLS